MADIEVSQESPDDPMRLRVVVWEGGSTTEHEVELSQRDFQRLSIGNESSEDFVRRCFEFLLAREPKESILSRFEIPVIGRYFPEFEQEITR